MTIHRKFDGRFFATHLAVADHHSGHLDAHRGGSLPSDCLLTINVWFIGHRSFQSITLQSSKHEQKYKKMHLVVGVTTIPGTQGNLHSLASISTSRFPDPLKHPFLGSIMTPIISACLCHQMRSVCSYVYDYVPWSLSVYLCIYLSVYAMNVYIMTYAYVPFLGKPILHYTSLYYNFNVRKFTGPLCGGVARQRILQTYINHRP